MHQRCILRYCTVLIVGRVRARSDSKHRKLLMVGPPGANPDPLSLFLLGCRAASGLPWSYTLLCVVCFFCLLTRCLMCCVVLTNFLSRCDLLQSSMACARAGIPSAAPALHACYYTPAVLSPCLRFLMHD